MRVKPIVEGDYLQEMKLMRVYGMRVCFLHSVPDATHMSIRSESPLCVRSVFFRLDETHMSIRNESKS